MVRCPDRAAAEKMIRLIERMRRAGDSVGGVIECVARGVPPGWGEPVFDRLEADLAKAMLSLPASKGFDIGSGFGGVLMTGLAHNDAFRMRGGKVRTLTNNSGGIQGGISNGETIYFRVAFKPVATVMREQQTVDVHYQKHDPPRPRPARSLRLAQGGADGGGDGGPGFGRARLAPARPVRLKFPKVHGFSSRSRLRDSFQSGNSARNFPAMTSSESARRRRSISWEATNLTTAGLFFFSPEYRTMSFMSFRQGNSRGPQARNVIVRPGAKRRAGKHDKTILLAL